GDFDQCQALVKAVFNDRDLVSRLNINSANSINIARLFAQVCYYFEAVAQLTPAQRQNLVIAVPSGNFGNICAGILASVSGLPVKHFLAACNENDVIPNFMQTQHYQPKKAVATVSNAMDVGNPSNFVRILEIFKQQFQALAAHFSSVSISDTTTIATIARVYQQYGYTLDPHGAVGFAALENHLKDTNDKGIVLETAHPIKFPDTVEKATGIAPAYPEQVKHLLGKQKQSVVISPDFEAVKQWLLNRKP
ncbi:MAG: threonine synthase, partial [Chitinophagaceae bacterium]